MRFTPIVAVPTFSPIVERSDNSTLLACKWLTRLREHDSFQDVPGQAIDSVLPCLTIR